jgi:hypothetical protein
VGILSSTQNQLFFFIMCHDRTHPIGPIRRFVLWVDGPTAQICWPDKSFILFFFFFISGNYINQLNLGRKNGIGTHSFLCFLLL